MLRTPYELLEQAGFTTPELMPKLTSDLEEWDYHAQNRAARFLLSAGSPHIADQVLSDQDRKRLATLLLESANGGSHGAQDATTTSRMAEWPVDALAAGLWWSLTRGRNRLDASTERVRDVLAAATMGGKLQATLDEILASDNVTRLEPVSGGFRVQRSVHGSRPRHESCLLNLWRCGSISLHACLRRHLSGDCAGPDP